MLVPPPGLFPDFVSSLSKKNQRCLAVLPAKLGPWTTEHQFWALRWNSLSIPGPWKKMFDPSCPNRPNHLEKTLYTIFISFQSLLSSCGCVMVGLKIVDPPNPLNMERDFFVRGHIWVFPKILVPQMVYSENGWFSGPPLFLETPI